MGIKGRLKHINGVSLLGVELSLIPGLTGLLSEHAPRAMKDHEMKTVRLCSLAPIRV